MKYTLEDVEYLYLHTLVENPYNSPCADSESKEKYRELLMLLATKAVSEGVTIQGAALWFNINLRKLRRFLYKAGIPSENILDSTDACIEILLFHDQVRSLKTEVRTLKKQLARVNKRRKSKKRR